MSVNLPELSFKFTSVLSEISKCILEHLQHLKKGSFKLDLRVSKPQLLF